MEFFFITFFRTAVSFCCYGSQIVAFCHIFKGPLFCLYVVILSCILVAFASRPTSFSSQAVGRRFPTAAAVFEPRPGCVRFVVDKVTLGQVYCEYLGFPWQPFHRLLHIRSPSVIQGWYNRPNSGRVSNGLSFSQSQETKPALLASDKASIFSPSSSHGQHRAEDGMSHSVSGSLGFPELSS
jgi:hypothetical protein